MEEPELQEADTAEAPGGVDEGSAEPSAVPLPDQHDFYKMPAKFGHVPVAEEPLGWDPKQRFEKLYPPVRLPTQVVERIEFGNPALEPNRLFFGDNLHVMRSLPSQSIDLIYIDPPFFSQRNYNVLFGDQNELRSFKDIWEGGLNGYLVWLNARLYEMKRLLAPSGVVAVHVDWHAVHYVKVELDKLFGYERFLNEIVWHYGGRGAKAVGSQFPRNHDVLLIYGRGDRSGYEKQYVENLLSLEEAKGRGYRKDEAGRWFKTAPRGDYTDASIARLASEGRVHRTRTGGIRIKYFLEVRGGKVVESRQIGDVWSDIGDAMHMPRSERIGYPTQKPEALVQRIVESFTSPEDLVADFYCGGGTTAAVAQRLNRRWIACDISRVAVSITADRVAKVVEKEQVPAKTTGKTVAVPDLEVCHWGIYEISGLARMSDQGFRAFILSAYEARLDSTAGLIHGYKGKEPIHVGPPDPDKAIRKEQVAEFANAVLKKRGSGGTGTLIAWAFTDAARKMAERIAAQQKVKLQFVKLRLIPVESPEFVAHVTEKTDRYADLVSFVLPPQIRVRRKKLAARRYEFDASESVVLNSGAKLINAQWDFDYQGYFTSTPGFELRRTKNGEPVLNAEYEFPGSGEFEIAVRVQDDLGGEAIHHETLTVG